jgi:hypothetical protein
VLRSEDSRLFLPAKYVYDTKKDSQKVKSKITEGSIIADAISQNFRKSAFIRKTTLKKCVS